MYKGFALAILLIAPLLVILADSITPKPAPAPVAQAAAQPRGAVVHDKAWAVAQLQTPAPAAAPDAVAGMPMADAGKPMLDLDKTDEAQPAATDQVADGGASPPPSAAPVNPEARRDQPPPGANLTAEWKAERR